MTGILKGYQIAKKGGKLLVDFETNTWLRPMHRYHPTERIVYDSLEEIIRKGYKPCYGYKSDLAYAFVPVYIKMTGFKKCEYRQGWVNLYTGQPCGMKDAGAVPQPLDTAGTLYDYYESKVLQKFKKYLAKVQMFKDLDLKMIGTVAVVAVGVILGIFMLLG